MSVITDNLLQAELVKIGELCALDWELEKADTKCYTHGYHPYSSKYIPQIPNRLISSFSERDDLILDPFLGSGTTLVESKILGRNAIGVDINPLACLISRVKTTVISKTTVREIKNFLILLQDDISHVRGNITLFNYGNKRPILDDLLAGLHPNIPKWYQLAVIYELATIKNSIDTIEHNETREFLLVAFSSILRSVSNAASGFGNLMINKKCPPKDRVLEKFSIAVKNMIQDMSDFGQALETTNCQATVINCDSRKLGLGDETIDFICTHPPYMAAVPYAEYQKLSLWWLGYDQSNLDKSLIGGRRSRRDTPELFFHDMKISLSEMKRVLRRKKYCCITIGNPVYAGKIWNLNDFIKQTCTDIGFTFLKEISRGKYHSTMGKMKEEFILIFRND
jgi:hypothetical protein